MGSNSDLSNLTDPAPSVECHPDGTLNASSFAFAEAVSTVTLAIDLILEAGLAPTNKAVEALAASIALVADACQARLSKAASPSWQERSRAVVMTAMRTSLVASRPPFGESLATWDDWARKLEAKTVWVLKTATDLWAAPTATRPWADLVEVAK